MTLADQLRQMPHALSVVALAELLSIDPETVRRHVRRNQIPHFKIGMTIRFDPHEIALWLEKKSL